MDDFDSGHRRFFVPPSQVSEDEVRVEGQDAYQMASVLRLRRGDTITVLDGTGAAYVSRITEINKAAVKAEILKTEHPDTEPSVHITLAQALPKGCKLELIVQKACELGISEVIGLITERTICRPAKDKHFDRTDRWQRVVKEAAEQCARAKIPSVRGILALDELPNEITDYDLALVAHEEERSLLLSEALKQNMNAKRVLIMVGPEGGFTDREIRMLEEKGAQAVLLGKRVLRAETAAIAACAIILNTLEGHL